MSAPAASGGTPLSDFQDAFAEALHADPANGAVDGRASTAIAGLVAQPGFAVYRNTVMKGCVDALQANYPTVTRLVGEPWLRAAAAVFTREHLPCTPALLDYGAQFADFLEAFAPAAALHYLADVARIDRLWTEAHSAADAAPLDATAVRNLAADELAEYALRPHPSARWRWFAAQPIYSIWRANRGGSPPDALRDLAWHGEGVLLLRPQGAVESFTASAAECAFLDFCGQGCPLGDAALAALEADAGTDLAALLERLLRAGAFTSIHRSDNTAQEPT